ncbi:MULTISPECIES: stage III sporulation protein SpoIIIAB [Oceanobacillus]|uniref:Stage III sporulation protein SpoAB n=2 Tax=Oceanobacillus TaxID=182709 RepID=A0A0A1MFD3_9BACI|nr:stage III sporulation protein SpoIIIAB [Oceanobacillus oncorhynchi]MDM8099447.1 stage III sporulation protein SpoIIIAB [Oceanobacillus oncorhynchi]CEI84110.1 stage III sporulation protein SpoAB [Oceanobacillus oncorhynchi]
MKWIGVLLLISMSTVLGWEWGRSLKQRPKHIQLLLQSLQILEAEMVYSQVPLQEAFQLISKKLQGPTALFYQELAEELENKEKDFDEIWEECAQRLIGQSALQKSDLEILLQFGRTLGQHDIEQQKKHIKLTNLYLEEQWKNATERFQTYGKLSNVLGLLCGIFLALLFM